MKTQKWKAVAIHVPKSKHPWWGLIQFKEKNLYDLEGRYKSESDALGWAGDYAAMANANKSTKAALKPKSLTKWKKIRD